jgi:hypothetical protein
MVAYGYHLLGSPENCNSVAISNTIYILGNTIRAIRM